MIVLTVMIISVLVGSFLGACLGIYTAGHYMRHDR